MFVPGSPAGPVDQVVADMSAAPPHIALDALRHAFTNEPVAAAALPALSLRTVSINPDDGRTHAESLRRHGMHTILVPGVGHFPMLEAPATFNRLLEDFVRSTSGGELAAHPGRPG